MQGTWHATWGLEYHGSSRAVQSFCDHVMLNDWCKRYPRDHEAGHIREHTPDGILKETCFVRIPLQTVTFSNGHHFLGKQTILPVTSHAQFECITYDRDMHELRPAIRITVTPDEEMMAASAYRNALRRWMQERDGMIMMHNYRFRRAAALESNIPR